MRRPAVVQPGLCPNDAGGRHGADGSGPSTALASGLADRAIADLRRAVAMGYRSPAACRYEPALAPLRGRDDFQLLLLDLGFPTEPFARSGGIAASTGPGADTGCDRRAGPVGCALRCDRRMALRFCEIRVPN